MNTRRRQIIIIPLTCFLIICCFFSFNQLSTNEGERIQFGNHSEILKDLGFYDDPIVIGEKIPEFTFVTALSDNHAGEGRHLVWNISRAFPGKKLYVYGMKLSKKNEEWFKNACNVVYRRMDLSRYPDHVQKFKTYAFKPLIIAETLKEFGGVFWLDTSTQFRSDRSITAFLQRLDSLELTSEEPHMFLFHENDHSNYAATHTDMYYYLSPYKGAKTLHRMQYSAAVMLIYRTQATLDLAMKWFVLCALEEDCIAPATSELICDRKKLDRGIFANCHRFDQSAINLILAPYDESHLTPKTVDKFVWTEWEIQSEENITIGCQ